MEPVARDLLTLLACPACRGELLPAGATRLQCRACGRAFPVSDGVPDLALRCERDVEAATLRAFYSLAPFPGYPPRESRAGLRQRAARSEFARLLDQAIAPDATVLEVGCGTGQMCLFLATGDRLVVGADLTRASLELAAAAARRLGVRRARFLETDLHRPALRAEAFDVVYCSGVLHHAPDPEAAFRAIARLARPGGFVVVGVYNAYARIPHRLRRGVARLTGLRWVPFDPVLRDRRAEPARRTAWLRDQYAHPQEHRHTLAEVQGWFRRSGAVYLRSYPSSLFAHRRGAALFEPAEDDWPLENVLQQVSWCWKLARDGGLFVAVGRKPEA
jgi:2-polyprenyl-3-methyl-5-hydroxy-6-metoxy-1,4-benzoquinol methylase/uncharacterized protein YbaR (Trm112 family)